GRGMLKTIKTVIVDEIHALARDKRGSHLALSLERLEALAPGFQRIGLSATQKPLSEVANFLVGVGRECHLVDVGHRRPMDVAIEVPPSPLSTICSHEQWDEIYGQIASLIEAHRTTLVFVNTRKLAERVTARLTERLGPDLVTCHHSSLSRQHRLDAEHRLKSGSLRALVATASLELRIDGRRGLLHRDSIGGRVMSRRRARITAITGGGAIADVADYRVLQDPDGTFVGTLNEDFAVEANVGDIFQLGNTSWRILKVERGNVRVADARGQPPTIPFWLGEGPSRTAELSCEIGSLREDCADPQVLQSEIGLS